MSILLSALMFTSSGCNLEVDLVPKFKPTTTEARMVRTFKGTLDGVEVRYREGDNYFTCNEADFFVYLTNTNEAVLNADSTQVECDPALIFVTEAVLKNTNIPLIE